ncbi:MAG: glycogen synthase GlgA [Phycisphaerales bacterium]
MLRIAFCAAEFAPLVKTGGLADVAAGLTRALATVEADQRIFIPCYDTLDTRGAEPTVCDFAVDVPIRMGRRELRFTLRTMAVPGTMHPIHLIDCPELYHRGGPYTLDDDEHVRWAFFARAVIESCQRMGFSPDIVHCNDWHTALVPLYLRSVYAWDERFAETKTLLGLHNIAYQGEFHADAVNDLSLGDWVWKLHQEHLFEGRIGFLETGILHADHLMTVSETYAREILEPSGGMGLSELLQTRSGELVGIINGVDGTVWDPSTDEHLPARYSAADMSGKRICRDQLLAELGLMADPAGPVLGLIARLTWQKGIDTIIGPLEERLASDDLRVVILGSGEEGLEAQLRDMADRHPERVSFWCGYNDALAHRIEAGADAFLMPSRFEPCGLNQLYSMRYGTVPVVHRTGGLADTVAPLRRGATVADDSGTGIVFEHPDEAGVRWALGETMAAWSEPGRWSGLVARGMATDYAWRRQLRAYLSLYDRMMRDA